MEVLQNKAYARRYRRILAVLFVLLFPFGFFLLLISGKPVLKPLPKFPTDLLTVDGDTIYRQLESFRFMDMDGQPFTEQNLRGRIHVANVMFTRCPGICPRISGVMREVQAEVKNASDIILVSYTMDPDFDSPSVLRDYAQQYGAIASKWFFVTGPDSLLIPFLQSNYLMAVKKGPAIETFDHSTSLVLVDHNLFLRGIYHVLDTDIGNAEKKRLFDEIRVLYQEFQRETNS